MGEEKVEVPLTAQVKYLYDRLFEMEVDTQEPHCGNRGAGGATPVAGNFLESTFS